MTKSSVTVRRRERNNMTQEPMRIESKPLSKYPWYLKPFFWNQKRKYGAVLDPALVRARSPRLFLGVAFLYGMIDRGSSPVPPVLRSLVTVRVSQINSCSFCIDINLATLLKRSVPLEKVEELADWNNSSLFSAQERLALEYAEAVTRTSGRVSDDLMERLMTEFGDDGVVELTGLIAFQNLSSKFNSALTIPAQGFCPIASEIDKLGSSRSPSQLRN